MLSARIDFDGAHVLDLYAGSGALGLEALSRGATTATFVEADRRAADVIAANVAALGAHGASVRRTAVDAALAGSATRPYGIVFADPPYDVTTGEVETVLATLTAGGWVGDGAVAIVERPTSAVPVTWPPGWAAWPDRRYGDTRLEFGEYGFA
ncbi:16S rRNA (guanine(966)-N(2))-methyltransferase RsmD [Mycolicibacterium sediminis]|uniref:16S rRNA (Guanine(966)-N(2))-methyltransferase RsmD n=1 Tax=Mycolicibacterium sediminis TaxID=1286180 RepID=A0A7I7QSP2_9MYCO|nr:16S rRNA (guanine(966)-N(2))-methyltransferase RsmD [Mycolicibacterium sediminis]